MKKLFNERGFEEYNYWAENDVKKFKKIQKLIKSIERDGVMRGEGKPEKLKHMEGLYSRRIDDEHRLVYGIDDEILEIISCKGHYE